MYVTVESFIQDYQNESQSTQKLLDALTDESLNYEVALGFRTLGRLAWHLATSSGMLLQAGLRFDVPRGDSPVPASAAAIAQTYRQTVQSLLEAVRTQWTDDTLQKEQNMFGQMWKNSASLTMLVRHEIHHRGQLTVLMRQAGLPVAGVYGPSKEEWAAAGMEAPAL